MLKKLQDLMVRVSSLEADLNPPLGNPGGIEHTKKRIEEAISDPYLEDELIDQLEKGENIPNRDARLVYRFDDCNTLPETTIFKGFCISSHGQYRMDQRGITVPKLKGYFFNLEKYIERNQFNRNAYRVIEGVEGGWEVKWSDPYSKSLTVVFKKDKKGIAKIITAYYPQKKDPVKLNVRVRPSTSRWN